MNIFGIGLPEMGLIMVVALLIFGPKKLPEIGRSMGKAIRGFQEASKEFENEFKKEAERIEKTVSEPMKATLEPSEPKTKALASAEPETVSPRSETAEIETAEIETESETVSSSRPS
ncbi:MAG: TatA/E family twin arginine-targeting protein translocase [Leptolyngbyaceae cyanobacterium CRU_2_3]|nr:TatA/E family twin arginine-targeting protein translocase [Leptolyngbyaceae cyanobacterium CRU_2_3]